MAAERTSLVNNQTRPGELSNALGLMVHGSTFVNVCGYNAFCSYEGQMDFRLRRLGSLLGFLVCSLIVGNPNMTWGPLLRFPPRPISPQTSDRINPFRLFLVGMNRQYGASHSRDIFVRSFSKFRILAHQEWPQPYLMSS
ncbi:hypothetical protein TNCV_2360651 [Trichonephila clavipes]|nr:hypothetical protein TNCV_2360651 [Trichonephila clavipes]